MATGLAMARTNLQRALSLGLLCVGAALSGCETQPTHEVIALQDLSPRQVEVGDRVVIHGSGFPLAGDIRRLTVRLSGTLSRPGLAACARPVSLTLSDPQTTGSSADPITGVEREAVYAAASLHTLRVEGGSRIEFTVTDEILRALSTCPGERAPAASHATVSLTGPHAGVSVEVETLQGARLASAHALRGPRIDLLAPWNRTLDGERMARAEAERTLGFLGIHLAAAHPNEGGLRVERVAQGSPADEAGILDGDVLERIDGTTLLGVGDLRPAPGSDTALLSVRRGDAVEDRPVRVTALTRGAPDDAVATTVLLLVGLAFVTFGMGSQRGLLAWTAARLADRHGAGVLSNWRGWRGMLADLGARMRDDRELAVLAGAAVSTTALAAPFGQSLCAADPDVAVWHAASAVGAVALSAAVAHGSASHGALGAGLRAAGRRAVWELPAMAAVGAAVALAGDLGARGVMASQGGAPWAWNLFRNPAMLVMGAAHLASLALLSPEAREAPTRSMRASAWTLLAARAALVSVTLLGGARVPGVELATQESAVGFQMLGAALMLAKAWAVVALLRWAAPRVAAVHPTVRTTLALRYLGPLSVIGAVLVVAGDAVARVLSPAHGELAVTVLSLATFGAVTLGAGVTAARAAPAWARRGR